MESFDDSVKKRAQEEANEVVASAREQKETAEATLLAIQDFSETIQPIQIQLEHVNNQLKLIETKAERQVAEGFDETRLSMSLRMAKKLREQLPYANDDKEKADIEARITELEGAEDKQPDSYKQIVSAEQTRIALEEQQETLQMEYEEAIRVFKERHGRTPGEIPQRNL